MPSNTGNRGYTYPNLGDSNDVPFYLQTLAEEVDADVNQVFNQAVFLKSIVLASPFTLNASSSALVSIPALTTTLNVTAGKRYRITTNVTSYSTSVSDIVRFEARIGGVMIGEFPKAANSGRDATGTSNYHTLTSYWVAPTTGPVTVTNLFARVVGTGTVTVLSTPTMQASVTVDDIGRA